MARKRHKKLKDIDGYLSRQFYDPRKAASFSSPTKLFQQLERIGNPHKITFSQIQKWSRGQDTITMNPGRIMQKKPRLKVVTAKIGSMYDTDLLDLSQKRFKDANDQTAFLLICIDVFSRYARVAPLKSKSAADVLNGFKEILPQGKLNELSIRSDSGREYDNKLVSDYMKSKSINFYFATSSVKSNFAERFILTLKRRLFKFFYFNSTYRYIDRLQDIVTSYNNTFHSSISMTPAEVTPENAQEVWDRQFFPPKEYRKGFQAAHTRGPHRRKRLKEKSFQFEVGSACRISYLKSVFSRDYDQVYSGEIFFIRDRKVVQGQAVYYLKDYLGNDVKGLFYSFELRGIDHDPKKSFKIEKILKTRLKNGVEESLIRWQSWGKQYDSWERTSDIKSLVKKRNNSK